MPAGGPTIGDRFRASVHEWTDALLAPYIEMLEERGSAAGAPKEFNDPVWGTIILRPAEIVLLDSPLLQRLRYIRQLGVVHLVYPAANHTRLEHSIGSVHQVDRLVEAINSHFGRDRDAPINAEIRNVLRLAALCHDIGHGALSHVSENALKNFDETEVLRLEFADELDVESVSTSEIAAYWAIGSDNFKKLLALARDLTDDRELPQDPGRDMQRAIVGGQISNDIPLVNELISGPFDADKLDYMARDALMTGVPVVTDMGRLVQKVRAVEVAKTDLPEEIAAIVDPGPAAFVITGIDISGGRTLDELMIGKALLYDKLYRHQKVRAAEAMIASIFREIGSLCPDGPQLLPYHLTDADFFELTRSRLEEVAGRTLASEEESSAAVAVDLSRRLRDRDLFVRAYAFAQSMPHDPYQSDPDHYAGLEALGRISSQPENRGRLAGEIADEVRTICGIVQASEPEGLPMDLKPYIWLDPPYSPPQGNDIARAFLVAEHGRDKVLRFSDDYAETTGWSNAYLQTRDIGYVFAPAELAAYTFLAAEKLLRERHGIRTPEAALLYAKQDRERIEPIRKELANAGYYANAPYDLRPVPDRLKKLDVDGKIERVLQNMAGYVGPVRGDHDRKHTSLLRRERVLAWLRQFDDDAYGAEPLQALLRLQVIGREQCIAALRSFLDSAGEQFAGACICPFGEPKDSSAVLTYWAGDLADSHGIRVMDRDKALTQEEAPIVFVDDFIGTGAQSIDVLEAWFDEDRTHSLGEDRDVLQAAAQAALRARSTAFVFACGTDRGATHLRDATERLGMLSHVTIGPEGAPIRAFEGALTAEQEAFRARCEDVGHQLLDDGQHDPAWINERLLGYGNGAFLIATAQNTPTASLTCLWASGVVDGIPWVPLLPRRKKR